MKNQIALEVNNQPVEIKSRREDTVSGWAIIAFTPICSIRSTKVGSEGLRYSLAESICAACGGGHSGPTIDALALAIHEITLMNDDTNEYDGTK